MGYNKKYIVRHKTKPSTQVLNKKIKHKKTYTDHIIKEIELKQYNKALDTKMDFDRFYYRYTKY